MIAETSCFGSTNQQTSAGPPQKAVITVDPVPKTVLIGDDVTFSCKATGVPTPNIVWQKDGQDIAIGGQ